MRLSKKLVIAALGSATLVLNPLASFAAGPTIEDTDGPLVRIAISDTLNCSINYKGDSYNEFYNSRSATGPADCGTFLAVGSELFGPGELNSRAATRMGGDRLDAGLAIQVRNGHASRSVGPHDCCSRRRIRDYADGHLLDGQ